MTVKKKFLVVLAGITVLLFGSVIAAPAIATNPVVQTDDGCFAVVVDHEARWSQTSEAVEGVKAYEWTRTLKAQKQVALPSAQHESKPPSNAGHANDFLWNGMWYHPAGNNTQTWVTVPDSLQPPHYGEVAETGTLPAGTYGIPISVKYRYLTFAPEFQTSTSKPAGSGWSKTGEWSWEISPVPAVTVFFFPNGDPTPDLTDANWTTIVPDGDWTLVDERDSERQVEVECDEEAPEPEEGEDFTGEWVCVSDGVVQVTTTTTTWTRVPGPDHATDEYDYTYTYGDTVVEVWLEADALCSEPEKPAPPAKSVPASPAYTG